MTEPHLPFGKRLRYGAEAALFFAFMALFRVIGLNAASALGGFIGRNLLCHLPPDRTARENLRAAFPEKTDAELGAIRKAMWDNLGRVVAEYPHLGKFSSQGDDPRITMTFIAGKTPDDYKGRALMFLSAHLANWEMLPILGEQYGMNGAAVVRPPNNPFVANWIARQRSLNGPRDQFGKHSGFRRMFAQLRGGKALYMLADQKMREGIAVPFFGRDAMTTPAPAALALKLNVPILIAANRRTKGARFHVTIHPGPAITPSGDEERDILALTAAITAQIETIIRADPGQWLWIHNRWPTPRDFELMKR